MGSTRHATHELDWIASRTSLPIWTMARSLGLLDRARRRADARSSFGLADQRIMWLFSDQQPRTLRTIATELGLEQSTANRQVNGALKAGLVRRFRDGVDPAWRFLLTPEGSELYISELDAHLQLLQDSLDALPPEDQPRFLHMMEAFVSAYSTNVTQTETQRRRDASAG